MRKNKQPKGSAGATGARATDVSRSAFAAWLREYAAREGRPGRPLYPEQIAARMADAGEPVTAKTVREWLAGRGPRFPRYVADLLSRASRTGGSTASRRVARNGPGG